VCGESGSLTRVTGRLFRPEGVRPKGRGAVSICDSAAGRENPHRPAADVRLTTPPCSGSNSHPAVPDDDSSSQRRPTATAANSDPTISAIPSAPTAPAARPCCTSTRLTKCAAPAITTPASTDQSSRRYPAQLAAPLVTSPSRSAARCAEPPPMVPRDDVVRPPEPRGGPNPSGPDRRGQRGRGPGVQLDRPTGVVRPLPALPPARRRRPEGGHADARQGGGDSQGRTPHASARAVASNSSACARAVSESSCPASIRDSSRTRSSPSRTFTPDRVTEPSFVFSTSNCRSAKAAT
jgi:hypothetical protein